MRNLPKSAQRRWALERRQALPAQTRKLLSRKISAAIADMDELKDVHTVMSYNAIGYETDLRALHDALRGRGVRLCFPVCVSETEMEAYAPEEDGALVSGKFSILEPDTARAVRIKPEEIEAVIVPCAAFDRQMHRIGHGGGYYDRFLPRCGRAVFVGAAFAVQEVERVSAEDCDVDLNAVVTEERIYRLNNC